MTEAACSDPIHVVCAADANYGPFAGITMSSVLNTNPPGTIHLHLICDGVRQTDLDRFRQMAREFNCCFSSYDASTILDKVPGVPRKIHHYTRTAYARLFVPNLFPTTVARVLYLDGDIICRSDLRSLWTIGDTVEVVGAVRDLWIDQDWEHKEHLGIPRDIPYVNSGVLLINVEGWRRRDVVQRIVQFLSKPNTTKHADQDAINAVLWNEITELPSRWNCLVSSSTCAANTVHFSEAANLHFCGGFKPWHLGYSFLVGTQATAFRKAKAASPWRWMPPDLQVGRIKRKTRQLLNRLPLRRPATH
jgi:lipopolysaccharide biosynthesis glycosyltransferase